MSTPRSTLHAIRGMDPDGHEWRTTRPTAADYHAFKGWVVGSFGWDAWEDYGSDWDVPQEW